MVNHTRPRSQRQAGWFRMGPEYNPEDGRFADSSDMRGRPWTINRALTDLCGIPGRTFFVAAENNGSVVCLSTPSDSAQLNHNAFFNVDAFGREANRLQQGPAGNQSLNVPEMGFSTGMTMNVPEANRSRARDRDHVQRENTTDSSTNESTRKSRKRPRATSRQRGNAIARAERMSMAAMQPKKGIRIGDSDAVYAFYDHRLRCCQQTACKTIAKAWVKAVAPKKQSTHPYTRGDETRPDWWPKTYSRSGDDEEKHLRHKEPDHLGKDERVYLLCHILRLVVEPVHRQHAAIRKVNLDLKTLETTTFEHLSPWLNDKDTPTNSEKKSLIKEIFKVAKQEAQYRDGGLDGNTEVFVKAISPDEYKEADSDDEEDLDRKFTPPSSTEPSGPPIMLQANGHAETGQFAGNNFADHVAMRNSQYPNPGFDPDLSERPNYIEAPGMGTHAPPYGNSHLGLAEMYPSPQESSRRSSVFNSPAEYGSPTTSVVYSPWSGSNAPTNGPMYGFQSQPHGVQPFGGHMNHGGPSYTASSIDGLPRPGAEAHHADVFAARGGQGAIHHQPSYPGYVTENSASLVAHDVKMEGGHLPPPPQ